MNGLIPEEKKSLWKNQIRRWAETLGFAATGFTEARYNYELESYLQQRQEKGWSTPFEPSDSRRRSDPQAVWEACRTVAVFAYPLPLSCPPQNKQGILARSAVGEDYHLFVGRKLAALSLKMVANGWETHCPVIQVDNGPLNERALAKAAGIGWLGRNQQLIVPECGSFIVLGLLLLDQNLPADQSIPDQCGECRKCIQACPVQILGDKPFAARECLSYLTQSKEILTAEQITKLAGRLFGCDTCQEACPYNKARIRKENATILPVKEKITFSENGFFEECPQGILQRGVDPMDMLKLSKSEFDKIYRKTAAGWRGKGILQRNAFLALRTAGDKRLFDWLDGHRVKKDLPQLLLPYVI
jgi:epoxyqueuosine reductase